MTTTRVGQVIRVRPESIEAYEAIHAAVWPGVLAAIRRANIRDYSIHRYGEYLFATYRHHGDDLAGDLAAMAADPVVQEWWTHTDAMQDPVQERLAGEWWHTIPEVFHTDCAGRRDARPASGATGSALGLLGIGVGTLARGPDSADPVDRARSQNGPRALGVLWAAGAGSTRSALPRGGRTGSARAAGAWRPG